MSREPCDMLFKPCEPGMQDCVGFGHCRCQKELDRQTNLHQQLATLTQERDALWEATRALVRAGDALYVKGKFADPDYWAPCNWATVVEESAKLLTPSGEAGKGGGV